MTSPLNKHYAILNAVRDNPGITSTGLAAETKLNIRTIQYHIKYMKEKGVVTAKKIQGLKCKYYLKDTAILPVEGNTQSQ